MGTRSTAAHSSSLVRASLQLSFSPVHFAQFQHSHTRVKLSRERPTIVLSAFGGELLVEVRRGLCEL